MGLSKYEGGISRYFDLGVGAGRVHVWKDGATTDSSQALYGSWPEALLAAQALRPSAIQVDPSGSPVIPAAAWDVDGIQIIGGDQSTPVVQLADGASLLDFAYLRNVTMVCHGTTVPAFTVPPGSVWSLTLDNYAQLVTDTGNAPFVRVGADVFYFGLVVRYFAGLSAGRSAVVEFLDSNVSCNSALFLDFSAQLPPNVLKGNGIVTVEDLTAQVLGSGSAFVSHTQNSMSNLNFA